MNNYEVELRAAMHASKLAANVILKAYGLREADPTAQANITTQTDLASQETILGYLMAEFPSDAFAAEEDTNAIKGAKLSGERLWVVDPIDGTRGFARKNAEFSVMIGFCIGGKVVAGVVCEPALDRYTYARLGFGCWTRTGDGPDTRCYAQATPQLSEAIFARSHTKNPSEPGEFAGKLGVKRFLESYSAGVKLAQLARGEADIYLNDYPTYRDWDLCAGVILVTEAGGIATDGKGNPLEFGRPGNLQDRGLVSSCAGIHQEILRKLS
jgi:3'(2'), 5'-bisphosphate nucleotidase